MIMTVVRRASLRNTLDFFEEDGTMSGADMDSGSGGTQLWSGSKTNCGCNETGTDAPSPDAPSPDVYAPDRRPSTCCAVVGFCFGALWALMPAISADLYGTAHLGAIYNTFNFAPLFGGLAASTASGGT